MTETDHETVHGTSVMERLRAARAAAAKRTTTNIPIANYAKYGAPQLVARYHVLEVDEVEEIGNRVKQQADTDGARMLYGAIDVMVAACDGIFLREPGGVLEPLDPFGEGAPLTFSDPRLADVLGFEDPGSARGLVRGVFPNDHMVIVHGMLLQRWMEDTSIRTDEDDLGEA
jgi:hypothetical protein